MLGYLKFLIVFYIATSFGMAFKAYKSQILRLDREVHHLDFLIECKTMGVIPSFLKAKSSFLDENFGRSKYSFEFTCLKTCIRRKYAVVRNIMRAIYGEKNNGLYYNLSRVMSEKDFDEALRRIRVYREIQDASLRERFNKKINNLKRRQGVYGRKDPSFEFINLSSKVFDKEQTKVLMKGPKHICRTLPSPKTMIPQFEEVVRVVEPNKKDEVRNFIYWQYKSCMKGMSRIPLADYRCLKALREDGDIAIVPTDKSNRFCILNKSDYVLKMKHAIGDLDCEEITGTPIVKFTHAVEKLVKYGSWPSSIKQLVKVNKLGIIPPIFGVVKDHKANYPLRPIVGKHRSPSYFVEKALVPLLKAMLPESQRVLSSTKNFVEKLEQLQLPDNYIMATLDVKALFPSVDVEKALENIETIVEAKDDLTSQEKQTIISALNLIIKNNYFVFDGLVYVQVQGAPMGSPISGLLAEYILRPFEESIIASAPIKPTAWFRFVDDVFVIWPETADTLKTFFDSINSVDPRLQFTIEYEQKASVSYMDVFLTRTNSGISRKVYRKPSNVLCTIPATSVAPRTYKLAAFRTYIHRALNVCTQENVHAEMEVIRNIATNNGYNVEEINRLISRITRHVPQVGGNSPEPKRIPLTYIPAFHEKLNNYLKPLNIQVVAKTFPKMKDYTRIRIDETPPKEKAGVYEIPYVYPDGMINFYIGMTTRKLGTRLKEHEYDIRTARETTALARLYTSDPTISIKFSEARIVAQLEAGRRSLVRESIEIYMRKDEICNEQDSMDVPHLWKTLL